MANIKFNVKNNGPKASPKTKVAFDGLQDLYNIQAVVSTGVFSNPIWDVGTLASDATETIELTGELISGVSRATVDAHVFGGYPDYNAENSKVSVKVEAASGPVDVPLMLNKFCVTLPSVFPLNMGELEVPYPSVFNSNTGPVLLAYDRLGVHDQIGTFHHIPEEIEKFVMFTDDCASSLRLLIKLNNGETETQCDLYYDINGEGTNIEPSPGSDLYDLFPNGCSEVFTNHGLVDYTSCGWLPDYYATDSNIPSANDIVCFSFTPPSVS